MGADKDDVYVLVITEQTDARVKCRTVEVYKCRDNVAKRTNVVQGFHSSAPDGVVHGQKPPRQPKSGGTSGVKDSARGLRAGSGVPFSVSENE